MGSNKITPVLCEIKITLIFKLWKTFYFYEYIFFIFKPPVWSGFVYILYLCYYMGYFTSKQGSPYSTRLWKALGGELSDHCVQELARMGHGSLFKFCMANRKCTFQWKSDAQQQQQQKDVGFCMLFHPNRSSSLLAASGAAVIVKPSKKIGSKTGGSQIATIGDKKRDLGFYGDDVATTLCCTCDATHWAK